MQKKSLLTGIAVAAALGVAGLFFIFNGSAEAINPFVLGGGDEQLIVQDQVVGTGAEAQPGMLLTIHYVGRTEDGTVFESTLGKQPVQVPLGFGQVIPGLEQGLVGMKEGGTRVLIIPPSLGFGEEARGPVAANSTIIFEVELVKAEQAQ